MPSFYLLAFDSDVIYALITGCLNGKYSGFTVDGTFSQYVVSWVTHVTPIPENLDSAEAASILCAVGDFRLHSGRSAVLTRYDHRVSLFTARSSTRRRRSVIGSSSRVRVEVLVTSLSNTQSPWVSVSSQSVSRPASAAVVSSYLIAHMPASRHWS